MGEVVPEIFDVLAPDAQAQQLRRGVLLPRPATTPLDGRLHATETRRVDDQLRGARHGLGRVRATAYVEGKHRAGTSHLSSGALETRVARKPRIANPLHGGMVRQPSCELRGVVLCALEANGERAEPAQREVRLHRARDRAVEAAL